MIDAAEAAFDLDATAGRRPTRPRLVREIHPARHRGYSVLTALTWGFAYRIPPDLR